MKKNVFWITLFFVIGFLNIHGQILNAGFENWNANGDPSNWTVSNAPPDYVTITKSSDAHSGSWAAEGNVAAFTPVNVAPTLYSGEEGELGIPINFRPGSLEGYYKLTPAENDFIQIQVFLYKNGDGVGFGSKDLNAAVTYTKFTCNISYFAADVPDTALILISVTNPSFFTNVGTKMFIDDLAWGTATDVNDNNVPTPNEFKLQQNYPNPFNPSTTISWQSPVSSWQVLKVFDVLGNEVITLLDEYKSAGSYEVEFDANGMSSGIYFYKLQVGNFVETKKMILIR